MPLTASSRSLWSPSPPPSEDWDDSIEEWEHDGIVNEEVDTSGKKFYEVKWSNWQRTDGTNTTWEEVQSDMAQIQDEWDEKRAATRVTEAKKSLDIGVRIADGQPWHEDRTLEIEGAYEEKLRERMRRGYHAAYSRWDRIKHIGDPDNDGDDEPSRGDSARARRGSRRQGHSSDSLAYPTSSEESAGEHRARD